MLDLSKNKIISIYVYYYKVLVNQRFYAILEGMKKNTSNLASLISLVHSESALFLEQLLAQKGFDGFASFFSHPVKVNVISTTASTTQTNRFIKFINKHLSFYFGTHISMRYAPMLCRLFFPAAKQIDTAMPLQQPK